jgi:hypothetical protein
VKIPELLQIMRWAQVREYESIWSDLRQQRELAEQIRRIDVVRAGISRAPVSNGLEWIWRDSYLRQQRELAEQICRMDVGGDALSRAPVSNWRVSMPPMSKAGLAAKRRAALDAYKAEVLSKTGRKLKNVHIWQAARYKDKSIFYRWQRGECESESIERVLREKPHLKPPQKPLSAN